MKIKIKPIAKSIRINSEELRVISKNPLSDRMVGGPISPAKEDPQYLLGMPVFRGMPFHGRSPMVIPVGQHHLVIEVLKRYSNKQEMIRRLISEYRSIVTTLMRMKIDFRILNLKNGEESTKSWLLERGNRGVDFPMEKPTHWHAFPRDMFVYLESVKTILVHSKLFKLWRDRSPNCNVIHTELAEGGQILFSDHHLIIGCHPEMIKRKRENRVLNQLREMGMKIIFIPQAILFALSREKKGKPISLYYESHIDRSASLLRGKDGKPYLVLDPYYQTGNLNSPLTVQKSIDLVRKICERDEIEIRIPKSLSIPYGTSAVQFRGKKTIVTGKDEEVHFTLAGILGSENLYATDIPLSAYPVFTGAGLHCLVTERPNPLI